MFAAYADKDYKPPLDHSNSESRSNSSNDEVIEVSSDSDTSQTRRERKRQKHLLRKLVEDEEEFRRNLAKERKRTRIEDKSKPVILKDANFIDDIPGLRSEDAFTIFRKANKSLLKYESVFEGHIPRYHISSRTPILGTLKLCDKQVDRKKKKDEFRYFARKILRKSYHNLINSEVATVGNEVNPSLIASFIPLEAKSNETTNNDGYIDKNLDAYGLYLQKVKKVAISNLMNETNLNPSNISNWLALSIAQGDLARQNGGSAMNVLEHQLSVLDKAIAKNPNNSDLLIEKAKLTKSSGDRDKMQDVWKSLLFRFPEKAEIWWQFLLSFSEGMANFDSSKIIAAFEKGLTMLVSISTGVVLAHQPSVRIFEDIICYLFGGLEIIFELGYPERCVRILQSLLDINFFGKDKSSNWRNGFQKYYELMSSGYGSGFLGEVDELIVFKGCEELPNNEIESNPLQDIEDLDLDRTILQSSITLNNSKGWCLIEGSRSTRLVLPKNQPPTFAQISKSLLFVPPNALRAQTLLLCHTLRFLGGGLCGFLGQRCFRSLTTGHLLPPHAFLGSDSLHSSVFKPTAVFPSDFVFRFVSNLADSTAIDDDLYAVVVYCYAETMVDNDSLIGRVKKLIKKRESSLKGKLWPYHALAKTLSRLGQFDASEAMCQAVLKVQDHADDQLSYRYGLMVILTKCVLRNKTTTDVTSFILQLTAFRSVQELHQAVEHHASVFVENLAHCQANQRLWLTMLCNGPAFLPLGQLLLLAVFYQTLKTSKSYAEANDGTIAVFKDFVNTMLPPLETSGGDGDSFANDLQIWVMSELTRTILHLHTTHFPMLTRKNSKTFLLAVLIECPDLIPLLAPLLVDKHSGAALSNPLRNLPTLLPRYDRERFEWIRSVLLLDLYIYKLEEIVKVNDESSLVSSSDGDSECLLKKLIARLLDSLTQTFEATRFSAFIWRLKLSLERTYNLSPSGSDFIDLCDRAITKLPWCKSFYLTKADWLSGGGDRDDDDDVFKKISDLADLMLDVGIKVHCLPEEIPILLEDDCDG